MLETGIVVLKSAIRQIKALFQAQAVIVDFDKFRSEYLEKWNQQILESNKINEKRLAKLISDMKFILRLNKSQ